jgi:hypothetical protein
VTLTTKGTVDRFVNLLPFAPDQMTAQQMSKLFSKVKIGYKIFYKLQKNKNPTSIVEGSIECV